jgi:hypothetical protein
MARHEALRETISSLKTVLSALEQSLELLNKALPDIERDIGFATNIRKITVAAGNLVGDSGTELAVAVEASSGSTATTRAPASKAKKQKAKAKSGAKKAANAAPANGTHAGDDEVYAFIKGQGKDGTSKKELVKATGHDGEKLRAMIERLREAGKVTSRGKTSQTRYFSS